MTEASNMELSASLEDYLEAILQIIQQKQAARAKDIGRQLKVGRSSVTGALHALAERKLINYAPYDVITLTDKGRAVAQSVLRRHEVLRGFFIRVLAVAETDADTAACKMEHAIPDGILDRFVDFLDFVERCPRGGTKWIKGFGYYCDDDQSAHKCDKCIELVLQEVRTKRGAGTTPTRAGATSASPRRSGRRHSRGRVSG